MTLPGVPAKVAAVTDAPASEFQNGGKMKTKNAGLWKYLLCLSLLVAIGLAAENFSEWSAPVNLGATVNSAFNDI